MKNTNTLSSNEFLPTGKFSDDHRYSPEGFCYNTKSPSGILHSELCGNCGKPYGKHIGMQCPESNKPK